MKSITKTILTLALPAVMLGATSCLNDKPIIDWSVIEPVIEIADNDHAQYSNNTQQGDEVEFEIIVNYTASYASDVTEPIEVELEVDLDTIAQINAGLAASEQPFEPFPEASYADLRLHSTIPAGCKRDTIYLRFTVDESFKVGRSYILPIKIAGASDGYIISGNFNHIELEVNMSEPEIGLAADPSALYDVNVGDPVTFNVDLAVNYPVTINEEVEAALFIDPSRIAILNASSAADDPYVELSAEEIAEYFTVTPGIGVLPDGQSTAVKIEAGTMKTTLTVEANTSLMQPGARYVLPIEIDYVSDYYTIGSGSVVYLEINMAE